MKVWAEAAANPGKSMVPLTPEPGIQIGLWQRAVKIQQHMIGKILGRGGSTVDQISEKTNCNITINQDTKALGFSFVIVTSLTHNPSDLDLAEQLVQTAGRLIHGPSGQGTLTKLLDVPDDCIAAVIGKGGETIKGMMAKVGCKVTIMHQKGNGAAKPNGVGTVEVGPGSAEQIVEAERLVMEKVNVRSKIITQHFDLAEEYVGMVIGKGGANIKWMSEECGVKIGVQKNGCGEPATVTIGPGTQEQIDMAANLVQSKAAEAAATGQSLKQNEWGSNTWPSAEPSSASGNWTAEPKEHRRDWDCPSCGDLQFARNVACRKCGGPRPEHVAAPQAPSKWDQSGPSPAELASHGSQEGAWNQGAWPEAPTPPAPPAPRKPKIPAAYLAGKRAS